jgi:hypothetical protein
MEEDQLLTEIEIVKNNKKDSRINIDIFDNKDTLTELDNNINSKLAIKKIGCSTYRTEIIKKYVRPNLLFDIEDGFIWRTRWQKISSSVYCIAEILGLGQTVLAFVASTYDIVTISFAAGLVGILCIVFNRFGAYANHKSSEKTNQLNEILIKIGIKDTIPDIANTEYNDDDKKN